MVTISALNSGPPGREVLVGEEEQASAAANECISDGYTLNHLTDDLPVFHALDTIADPLTDLLKPSISQVTVLGVC